MPHKARLKTGEARKRPKPNYAVTNAHEYNESLKRRGQLSLYCPDGDLKALFINDAPYQHGVSGQCQTYSDAYLELIFMFYRLFGWGMRQIAGHHVCDEAGLDAVLAVEANVDCVIADGAYYSIAQIEAWSACGVLPVIPPPANAVVHDQPATRWHDHLVRYIKDKGIHAFRNKYGYGQRALVESQISRIKRCIGAQLLTRRLESQQCEGVIIANLLNLWNSFGRPVCVKNA